MKRFITALSPSAEIAIVLLVAFGTFAGVSFLIALRVVEPHVATDGELLRLVVFEAMVLALLVPFLHMRGWRPSDFGFKSITLIDVIDAFGLLAVAYLIPASIWLFVPPSIQQAILANQEGFAPEGISLPVAVIVSVVNPIFEEFFVVGYVFAAWRGASATTAINVSIALRLLYHLYQGPASIIFVLPMAVVFAWWFTGNRRIAPLILAHAALEFIGLAQHLAR